MSELIQPSDHSNRMFRPIELAKSGDRWIASPNRAEGSTGIFAPFYLTPPPRTLIDWLVVAAGQRFWKRQRRCMAALLLIDCGTGNWTLRLPRQRCKPDRAVWSLSRSDFANLPDTMRVGGTFQSVAGGYRPQDVVPAIAGFHFTLALSAPKPLSAFIRHGECLEPIEPMCALTDDWATTLDSAQSRLRIA